LENYYTPLQQSFAGFLERHQYSAAAKDIVAAEEHEIALYRQHQEHVSYGMYVARNRAEP
jgi:hypothetical protein